jgi:hypothetical protein
MVWWADLLWGFWNGLTAWIVLVVHIFGGWEQYPFYNEARSGNWYDFGFLLGAGSPLLGAVGGRGRRSSPSAKWIFASSRSPASSCLPLYLQRTSPPVDREVGKVLRTGENRSPRSPAYQHQRSG